MCGNMMVTTQCPDYFQGLRAEAELVSKNDDKPMESQANFMILLGRKSAGSNPASNQP